MITEEDLVSLVTLRELSLKLQKRTKDNYRAILGFNSLLILLAMLGILTPIATALLHNTSTILIGMHSMTNFV